LAYSDHSTNSVAVGYNEAYGVWSIGPLDPASRHLTAFMAMGGLYQWTRVAMGLKGSGPYFQRSMSNTVLAGLVYHISELYIDDVLIHGRDIESFLANVRKVFERLREFNVAVNPAKTKLGLAEVEYVGHVVSTTGTSFTEEKRLKVLKFPLPETQKYFIGLANASDYGIGGYVFMVTNGKVTSSKAAQWPIIF
jgi:hypothetical protein